MRLNLTARILLLMAGTVALGLALFMGLFTHIKNRQLDARLNQDATIVADLAQKLFASDKNHDLEHLQSLVDGIARLEVVRHVEIYDRNARLVVRSNSHQPGGYPLPAHAASVHKVLATGTAIHEADDAIAWHVCFVPLHATGTHTASGIIGVAEIAMNRVREKQLSAAFNNDVVLGTTGIAVTLVALLFVLLKRFVLTPLRILTDAATRLGSGELDRRVALPRHDEMGQLAASFNRMAENLQRGHQELETAIRERTTALESTIARLRREVDERLRTEEDLRTAKELAEAASRSKSEFLAVMSHELRTPLNTVLGMLELLLNDPDMKRPQQHDFLELASQAGRDLLTLINDLLDLSRIAAGKLALVNVPFDIRRTAAEVIDLLDHKARAKGVELFMDYSEDVPSTCCGDPGRVRQVLINLLDNAIKFTGHGHVLLRVSLDRSDRNQPLLRISVADTGIGISTEQHQLIFEKFTQLDASRTRRHGGAGLGLAICKQLVESMGGSISLTSHPGQGTTFWFTLPVMKPEECCDTATREPASDTSSPRSCCALARSILLAEDNRLNQITLKAMLEQLGCHVEVAATGREVLERLHTPHCLILMDISMPEMDGYEATAEIRRRETDGRHVPIIALTAHSLKDDLDRTRAAGMDDYLCKPVGLEGLRTMLTRWCPGGRHTQHL